MIIQLASLLLAQAASAQATPPPPPPCTGAEFEALDFWVGDWDVYPNGRDTMVAHSKIDLEHGQTDPILFRRRSGEVFRHASPANSFKGRSIAVV